MITRKEFFNRTMALSAVAFAGIAMPSVIKADAAKLDEALKKAVGKGMSDIKTDGRVNVIAPTIAESGANVPVKTEVSIDAAQVKSVHVFVDNNPAPLALGATVSPEMGKVSIEARLRFAKSSTVRSVVVLKDGSVIQGEKKVKVTVGGCG